MSSHFPGFKLVLLGCKVPCILLEGNVDIRGKLVALGILLLSITSRIGPAICAEDAAVDDSTSISWELVYDILHSRVDVLNVFTSFGWSHISGLM
jgi:hypothetical protein